jgi:hypothetical protein
MQVNYIAMNQGSALAKMQWVINYNDPDLVALGAVTSGQVPLRSTSIAGSPLFQIPAGGKVLGVEVKASVAFTGTGPLTALTASLGKNGGTTTLFTSAFDIFQAVGDTVLQETALYKLGQRSALVPAVNFVATGGNLNVLTAGSVTITILFENVTTPSIS